MTTPSVLALAAHPDDIEFMMAGTLLRLGDAGYAVHLCNLCTGNCGSMVENGKETAARRWQEAQAAAAVLKAVMYPPIAGDLELAYTPALLRRVAAVVRQAKPDIVLLPSPEDYMEDHMIAARLGVTAAFARSMPNFQTEPAMPPHEGEVAVYHALPYGLRDGMNREVRGDFYVDISAVLTRKRQALACHESQKRWLDESQGLNSYLHTMEAMSRAMGEWSGCFAHAEGWRRHNPLGFGSPQHDPLAHLNGTGKPTHE